MADCFTMPNADELVVELRALSGCIIYGDKCDECGKEEGNERKFCRYQQEEMCLAADAIEQLMQENAKLKAERDAAVADLKDFSDSESCCFYCRKRDIFPCSECIWEWRGVTDTNVGSKKEEEDG